MPFDRFLIAPLVEGLVANVKPWLLPNNAFAVLKNAYIFRSRLKKRFGSQYMEGTTDQKKSRLRIKIGTTNGGGNLTPAVTLPGSKFKVGQQFSVGDILYTVTALGTPATMISTGIGTVTFNTTTGAVSIAGSTPLTDVYWYPSEPVMIIPTFNRPQINNEYTFAFDTQFSYYFNIATEAFDLLGTIPPAAGSGLWTNDTNEFYWTTVFRNADETVTANNRDLFFVVNNKAYNPGTTSDGIKYWEEGASLPGTWTSPQYRLTATKILYGARLVIPFKGRLLFFSTIENDGATTQSFINRVRFSWTKNIIGEEANAFFEESGKGGYLDAPTSEAIITAQFIRDRLVVYFERSTFQLVYVGSPDLTFAWQKIDTAIGAESMLSQVPFDSVVLGIGTSGVYACNGAGVQRIDQKIPQAVFQITNTNNAFERVSGIRDFDQELVYWTFPAADQQATSSEFPQRVLVYDYINKTWALNDDSFTAFGYHTKVSGFIWANWHTPWQSSTWPWSYSQNIKQQRLVVAGNQQGYVLTINPDLTTNAAALSITNFIYTAATATLTIINHNLNSNDYIKIETCLGITGLNGKILPINSVPDADTITVSLNPNDPLVGVYTGNGTVRRVSIVDIYTKQYNFYTDKARNTFIPYVEFLVNKVTDEGGGIQVDYFVANSVDNLVTSGTASGTQLGSNFLETTPYVGYPFEASQDQFWHRIYFQAVGETVQFHLYFKLDEYDPYTAEGQALLVAATEQQFELNAFLIYASPEGSRLGV